MPSKDNHTKENDKDENILENIIRENKDKEFIILSKVTNLHKKSDDLWNILTVNTMLRAYLDIYNYLWITKNSN